MRPKGLRRGVVVWSFLLSCVCSTVAAAGPIIVGLPTQPRPPGPSYSYGQNVSGDGSTVVGTLSGNGRAEAFQWTNSGGMVGLGFLPQPPGELFYNSNATAASADGSTVVGSSNSTSGVEAFRWTSSGGMVGLGDLPGGDFRSHARDISADGSQIAGVATVASGEQAFLWTTGGGMVGLGYLPGGSHSIASGISADGSKIVGVSTSASGFEAFLWTSGSGMVSLGDLPGGSVGSGANAISADGSTVVGTGRSASGEEAFRWTSNGGMVGLGELPGGDDFSRAVDVSADGSTIVGHSYTVDPWDETYVTQQVFIWDATHGMRELTDVLRELGVGPELDRWTLEEVRAISNDGRVIVGTGYSRDGYSTWLVIIPEPGTGLLALAGLLGLATWRRARPTRP